MLEKTVNFKNITSAMSGTEISEGIDRYAYRQRFICD